jgi:hypothetical protein
MLVVPNIYQIISLGNINTLNKCAAQFSLFKNLKSFNPQMEQLSTDFKNSIHENLNIYAFGEGLPLDKKWVKFSFHHIESYPTRFIS